MNNAPFPYSIEPLTSDCNRSAFDCGVSALNRYLQQQASQDLRRRLAITFVLLDRDREDRVAGFYTLAASAVSLADLPQELTKKLPKYPLVPAILLGRLALDLNYQQQGLGSVLLFDALKRCLRQEIPVFLVIVDAKDDRARAFYEHYGFSILSQQPNRLFVPMTTVTKFFKSGM